MKKYSLLIILVLTTFVIKTQDVEEKKTELKWSGFMMNNFYYDNRKNLDAVDGLVLLYPLNKDTTALNTNDLNAIPNACLLSLAARLRLAITGPDAFNASTSAYIEFDFTGRSNTAHVRFRQGWVKLAWKKTDLLVGRTWHPIVVPEVAPGVMAMSWGAPVQPFNRSEQITVTQKFGKLSVIASANYQNDYANYGPDSKSFLYQNNAIWPNLHLQAKYKTDNIITGIGVDYKWIKPRQVTASAIAKYKYKTDVVMGSYALLAYGQYKKDKFCISAKSILGQNMSENQMIGSFGVSALDTTGKEEYTPITHFYVWGNFSYGGKLKGNLFGGYLKNLGAAKDLVAGTKAYGIGTEIASFIRVSPTVSYTYNKLIIAAEVENNFVSYGIIDHADKGKIKNPDTIYGRRILLTMMYNF